jgi:hypothetical protein
MKAAVAAVIVSAVSQLTQKNLLKKTYTHIRRVKKKEKEEKSNVVCCKMYVLSFSVFRMPLTS